MTMFGQPCQLWAVLVVLVATWPAQAADHPPLAPGKQSRLAEWLDAEVGLCLQFDNLAEQWARFAAGPLYARIQRHPPVALWLDQQRPQLAAISNELQRRTGASARDIGTGLLGRQVWMAVWPPANPLADKPTALLLVEAADRQLLTRSLDKLVAARRQAGRWRGKHSLDVGGETFNIEAVVPDDEQSDFFLTSADNVAIVATSETLVRTVLERRAAAANSAGSLASSAAFLAAGESLSSDSAVRLFINPRAWDDALNADLERKTPGSEEANSQATLLAAWRATEYVAGGIQLTPQAAVELAWKWRADALPEPVREVAASFVGRSQFVDRIPADALLACAGHVDLSRLVRSAIAEQWRKASSAAADADRKVQGESILIWALSAGLGPDWGAFVTAAPDDPSTGVAAALPIEAVAGIQTRPLEPQNKRPTFAENVEPLLHALLSATVEATNRRAGAVVASMSSGDDSGSRLTSILGIVPGRPGQELAYCVDQDARFWLGTSARSLKRASSLAAGDSLLAKPDLKREMLFDADAPSGLLYVNLAGWRKLATQRPNSLSFLWGDNRMDAQQKDRQLRLFLAAAKLADRLVAVSHIAESTVHFSLSVSADGP